MNLLTCSGGCPKPRSRRGSPHHPHLTLANLTVSFLCYIAFILHYPKSVQRKDYLISAREEGDSALIAMLQSASQCGRLLPPALY